MGVALNSPSCVLSAIVDPSPAAVDVAAKAGVPLYTSIDELMDRDRPEGLILATPNHLHVPQALQCIQAGLPLLLEKPIATTVAEGEKLVKVVDETGAKVLIGHHRAHSPIMAKAREVVDSGKLGKLVAVMGSATFFKPDHYYTDAPWRREIGGGPILLNMIHEVHNLRMLGGDIDACPRSWEQTSQENKAYPSYGDEDCYVITGTNGSLSVPTMRLKTYPRPEDRSWWKGFEVGVVGMVRDDPLKHQIEHFGRVIRGEAEPLVSARDGLLNLRITEAIAEAARTGRVIELASL